MKIDLKKTTKDKLYTMLCDADAKCEELERCYQQLETDSQKRIDQLNDDLAAAVKEKNEFRELAEKRREKIDKVMMECVNLKSDLDWCRDHPWKHLWWCLRGKNK